MAAEITTPPWRVHVEKPLSPEEAMRLLGGMALATVGFTGEVHMVVGPDNKAVAVTGCGPKSAAHAVLLAGVPRLLAAVRALIHALPDDLSAPSDVAEELIAAIGAMGIDDA